VDIRSLGDWRAGRSHAEHVIAWLARADPATQARLRDRLSPAVRYNWRFWARPSQLSPRGRQWSTWLILAGRGFGKTRAGAEYVRGWAQKDGSARIALVGATWADVRDVMVEGPSGLIAIAPPAKRPRFESSKRRLVWPNGAMAFLYSAEEPDQLRGPEHHLAWCDELAKWEKPEAAWTNLRLGLRLGERPRTVVTTTPRPLPLLKELMADPKVAVTRGATRENATNLPPAFLEAVEAAFAGTRLGRQELEGELVEEVEGALWTPAMIERARQAGRAGPGPLARVVVAVDPPAGTGPAADACGIIVAARAADGLAWVLADRSVQGLSPEGWARAVAAAAAEFAADRVVAEVNNGGAMVESVLRAVEPDLPVRQVRAAHGKVARAEPVAALYEAGRVAHAARFERLEAELEGLLAGGGHAGPGRSPDRADALVWALSELMLGGSPAQPAVRII
jgi:phage terminase large subunit-like protein